jgi:hypothetical protein
MTMRKGVLRALLVTVFFVNMTALFLTHFGMAKYPCDPSINPNEWCIGELNPLQKPVVESSFLSSLAFFVVFWMVVFAWWEFKVSNDRYAWITPVGLMLFLGIDLFNNILVLFVFSSL